LASAVPCGAVTPVTRHGEQEEANSVAMVAFAAGAARLDARQPTGNRQHATARDIDRVFRESIYSFRM